MSQHKDKVTGKWYYTGKYRDMLGKRHDYKKRGFATKKEAKDAEITFLQKLKGGYGRIKFEDLTELYNQEIAKQKKGATVKSYKSMQKNYLLPYFTGMYIDKITPLDISKWSEHCAHLTKANGEPKCSPDYIKIQYLLLYGMFSFAIDHKLVTENPCKSTTWYQDPNALPNDPPSKDNYWEIEMFYDFMETISDPFWNDLYEIIEGFGLRVGELCSLQFSKIFFNTKQIKIDCTYSNSTGKIGPPKSPNSYRTIEGTEYHMGILKRRYEAAQKIDGFNEDYFVFGDLTHLRPDVIRAQLEADILAAGDEFKRITPHGLRHTHASHLLSNPLIPEQLIAERLGHTIEVLRRTYSHIYEKHRKSMVLYLEERPQRVRKSKKEIVLSSECRPMLN